jgi:hypothetical protein
VWNLPSDKKSAPSNKEGKTLTGLALISFQRISMSVPMFISVFSSGEIWVSNGAGIDPKVSGPATGTLVSCYRVNSVPSLQKIATLTGSGNASASALADSGTKGTGTSGSRHTQKELV